MIRLKDFKVREKKSVLCFVLQNYVRYLKPFQKHPWYCQSLTQGGDVTLGIFGTIWRHFWFIQWERPGVGVLVNILQCTGLVPGTKNLSKMSTEPSFTNTAPEPSLHSILGFHHWLPTGVTPGPVLFAALSKRASINPRNIWNEIPAAELLWKAVTHW